MKPKFMKPKINIKDVLKEAKRIRKKVSKFSDKQKECLSVNARKRIKSQLSKRFDVLNWGSPEKRMRKYKKNIKDTSKIPFL